MGKKIIFIIALLLLVTSSYASGITWNIRGGGSYLNGTQYHDQLLNLKWSVAGHTMDSDLVMIGSNKIIFGENATYFDFDGANLYFHSSAPFKVEEDFDMRGNNIYGVSNLTTDGDVVIGDHLVFGNETNDTAFDNPTIYRNGPLGLVFYADDENSNITFTAGANGGNFLNYMRNYFTNYVNFTQDVNFLDTVNFLSGLIATDIYSSSLYVDNIYGYTDDGFTMFTGTADNQINISETSGYGYGASPYLEGVWDIGGFFEVPYLSTGGMISKPKVAGGSLDYIGWLVGNGEADDSDVGGLTWTNAEGTVIYCNSDGIDCNITNVPQGFFKVGNDTKNVNSYFNGDLNVFNNVNISENLSVYGASEHYGQVNKTGLYGKGNMRIGSYYDSGGQWGTGCYESELTGIGGADTVWCIDNGGDNLRFYDPRTSDVSMRANKTGWQIGDLSHIKHLFVSGMGTFLGNLDVKENITGNLIYAQMGEKFGYDTPLVFSFGDPGVYYNITNMTYTNLHGFEYHNNSQATGGSYLTAQYDGTYKVEAHFSGEGSVAGGVYGLVAVKNFDKFIYEENCYVQPDGTTNSDVHSLGCIMELSAGDNVSIQVEDEADPTKDIEIASHNFIVWRIGN